MHFAGVEQSRADRAWFIGGEFMHMHNVDTRTTNDYIGCMHKSGDFTALQR
jgi:hypothetical protein